MDRTKIIACLAVLLGLSACSGKRHLAVGSKNFTEANILGEIVAQHLENRLHQLIDRRSGLGGTLLAQQALLANEIDVYPEYTGTGYTNVLKRPPIHDPATVLAELRAGYAAWKLDWLDPLGFNNSFAMVVRGEDARSLHLETLSDAAKLSSKFVLGAGYEFLQRPDGFAPLTSAYGFVWKSNPKSMDLGLLYEALRQKQVDIVSGSVTDGVLSSMDAKILKDDKGIFPPYQASLVVRSESMTAHPELRAALLELSGRISDDAMRRMNNEVDGKHRQTAEVAREFLKQSGL